MHPKSATIEIIVLSYSVTDRLFCFLFFRLFPGPINTLFFFLRPNIAACCRCLDADLYILPSEDVTMKYLCFFSVSGFYPPAINSQLVYSQHGVGDTTSGLIRVQPLLNIPGCSRDYIPTCMGVKGKTVTKNERQGGKKDAPKIPVFDDLKGVSVRNNP